MIRRTTVLALVLGLTLAVPAVTIRSDDSSPEPDALAAQKPIADLDLSDTTLEKAFDRLRALTGANIVVRWPAMAASDVKRQTPVKMRLWNVRPDRAMTMLLRYVEGDDPFFPLSWAEEAGVVTVSTEDDLSHGQSKVYDVRDLLAVMAGRPKEARPVEGDGRARADVEDELVRLIMDTVLTDSWRDNGGTVGTIRYFAGRFVITQSFEGHRQVRRLLQDLRREFVEKDEKPATSPSAPTRSSPRPAGG